MLPIWAVEDVGRFAASLKDNSASEREHAYICDICYILPCSACLTSTAVHVISCCVALSEIMPFESSPQFGRIATVA